MLMAVNDEVPVVQHVAQSSTGVFTLCSRITRHEPMILVPEKEPVSVPT